MPQQKWNLGDIRSSERGPSERGMLRQRKRPIEDMRPRDRSSTPEDAGVSSSEHETGEGKLNQKPLRGKRPAGRGRGKILWIALVLILLVIGFLTTFFLRGAELTVYPKSKNVAVQTTFTAYQKPETGMLGYELLTLEETGEQTVTASGSEEAKEQATGELTIHNAFSTDPQRLIKNTRFESADGKIFRVQDSVVVPGYTTNAASEKVPGMITAKVFADVAGEEYNIMPGTFTIPGLKGSPQFEAMTARSKAQMQGGFIGQRLIVAPDELTRAKEAVQVELKEKLVARLESERPASFELYESATRVRFESLPSVDGGQGKATIREKAILEAPLFSEGDFARYLAENTIAEYKGEDVRIENPRALTFSYVTATTSSAIATSWNKIDFTLSGKATVVWTYDQNKLREEIAGAPKKELPTILLSYQPAIERATTVMRPFWRQSFPDNPAKIKIIEVIGGGK